MAFPIFDLTWSGRTLEGNVLNNTRQYKKAYFVMSDSPNDDEATLRADPRCPKKLDSWGPNDAFATVTDVSIRKSGPRTWTVEANYVGQSFQTAENTASTITTLWTRKWTASKAKVPILYSLPGTMLCDATGAAISSINTALPISNVNGEPFDPPFEVDKTDVVLHVTGHYVSFDPNVMFAYNDTINMNPLTTFNCPAHAAKLSINSAEDVEVEGVPLVKVEFEIVFRNDVFPGNSSVFIGHDVLAKNQGYLNRLTAGGPVVEAKEEGGKASRVPVGLAADGTRAATVGAETYYIFRMLPEADWTEIGIT